MNHRLLATIAAAAAIAFADPVASIAQDTGRAPDILAATRKAIGDKKLDSLKTFSVQSSVQRNLGGMQIDSDVEVLLDLPDKYVRTETMNGGGGMVMRGGGTTGFNGAQAVQKADGSGPSGAGGMVIRMDGAGSFTGGHGAPDEKPTPEQEAALKKAAVRLSQIDASRLMLGWFAMAHPVIDAKYVYAGEAQSPDGKAYVIDVTSGDDFSARLFIDEDSHLPLMVTYKGPKPRVMTMTRGATGTMTAPDEPPEMGDYTLYFEDWRAADGVKFPFKIRRSLEGTTTEEWTVGQIKVNPRIDPKRFAIEQ